MTFRTFLLHLSQYFSAKSNLSTEMSYLYFPDKVEHRKVKQTDWQQRSRLRRLPYPITPHPVRYPAQREQSLHAISLPAVSQHHGPQGGKYRWNPQVLHLPRLLISALAPDHPFKLKIPQSASLHITSSFTRTVSFWPSPGFFYRAVSQQVSPQSLKIAITGRRPQ